MIQLLGVGVRHEGVVLGRDEFTRIQKLYGYVKEQAREKPAPPSPPKRADFDSARAYEDARRGYEKHVRWLAEWEDPRSYLQAHADRDALRHAVADGLRLLAWLAKYVPSGSDPLKALIQIASDAGWDVDLVDYEWATAEDFEEETETQPTAKRARK